MKTNRVVLIEAVSGNLKAFIVNTGFFLLIMLSIAVYGIALLLDCARFNLYKREYHKNKAAFIGGVGHKGTGLFCL